MKNARVDRCAYHSGQSEELLLQNALTPLSTIDKLVSGYAHQKGEVVGPAGGVTGVPRCLAEVRKLPKAASFHYYNRQTRKTNPYRKTCQTKK